MNQIVQDIRRGTIAVAEVPAPAALPGRVLVQVLASLLSNGTERSAFEFAHKGLLGKARARPDLVRQVMAKARAEGVLTAFEAVRSRLARPAAPGYSCAGTILEVGPGVTGLRPGDRVACAGAGYAVHAEVVGVPQNLLTKLPDSVCDEAGAFAALGAVALHGLRQSGAELGETVAVIGLGLVGLLTVQVARAAGCRVLGMDLDPERCRLALGLGCRAVAHDEEQLRTLVAEQSGGLGADRVILAAATPSDGPVTLAGQVARDRGVVVAIGDVGLGAPRRLYYEKELTLRVSRSYGPGRYDPAYEEQGRDYPPGYVRWTEGRNLDLFVQLAAEGKVDTASLVTHRFSIRQAAEAYQLISGDAGRPFLGVVLTYPERPDLRRNIELAPAASRGPVAAPRTARVGLLGAGSFAMGVLLPALRRVRGVELAGVCAASGLSARHAAARFGFRSCATDERAVIDAADVNTVVVATPHHLHASQVIEALGAGKHVFCEKPLALNESELRLVMEAHRGAGRLLMVGFNRRFSPMARRLRDFMGAEGRPLVMRYRVNAGRVPAGHWLHDRDLSGGCIVGEACHFVDLLQFLCGALPERVYARSLPQASRHGDESVTAVLEFSNGSVGEITYVTGGDAALGKERLEVFGGGRAAVLDNFRRLELMKDGRARVYRSRWRQQKGYDEEWEAFVSALRAGGPAPVPVEELVAATLATFRIQEALRAGAPLTVGTHEFLASRPLQAVA